MRIFYDTNVILDLLANRREFVEASARAISVADSAQNVGFMSVLTVCDIVYIMRKSMTVEDVGNRVVALEDILQVTDVTRNHVMSAFDCDISDYEDAVQSHCAESVSADVIVTRDPDGFIGSSIRVLSPQAFLDLVNHS